MGGVPARAANAAAPRRDSLLGAAIANRDFQALASEDKARLYDPYFACFQACVHDAAAQLAEEPQGSSVELIFDNHPTFRGLVCDAYSRYRQQLPRGKQLGSLVFASSVDTPALQAADLMAYELRLFWRDCRRSDSVQEPKRYPMRELLKMTPRRSFFHLFGPEALSNWLHPKG